MRANVIGGRKKINIRSKKIAEPISKGSLKESLLNAPFNNGSRHITFVKDSV
jgi:hypothetical protein